MTSATSAGMRREAEAQVAAIEQQSMVGLAIGGDELVHDAAVGADELVLDALAEAGEHRARIVCADQREDGQRGDDFQSGGAGEAGAERHVAPEAQAEAGNLVAFAGEDGDDAHRVVAPVLGWRRAWRRRQRSFLRRSSRPR